MNWQPNQLEYQTHNVTSIGPSYVWASIDCIASSMKDAALCTGMITETVGKAGAGQSGLAIPPKALLHLHYHIQRVWALTAQLSSV